MEESNASDANGLLSLLSQGNDQMAQLEAMLDAPCKPLAQQVQFTFQQAISIAKSMDFEGFRQPAAVFPNNTASDSPRSNSGSPRSENSGRIFKEHDRREMCKKRKTLPKWTNQVRVSSAGEAEGLDDGFSWRKYGQKDILGARHPRGYYRCTHRSTLGCLATKQVQRSDDDPCVFDLNYRGEHTCLQKSPPAPQTLPTSSALEELDLQKDQLQPTLDHELQHLHHRQENQQLLLSFKTSLKVNTEGLEIMESHHGVNPSPSSSSFSFPSTHQNHMIFSSVPPTLESNFMGGFSAPFVSPAASESNYFSVSKCQTSGHGGMPMLNTASESELTEIISAATSMASSPMVDSGFMLDYDPSYAYDASNYFGEIL